MKIVLLLVILIVYCSPQVAPIWSQTIRIDTGDIILINSGIATTSWVTTWSTTYTNGVTFSNAPWVALSIRQIRIASNNLQIGIKSYINSMPTTTGFQHQVTITSPTQVWYLKVRYVAYDRSYNLLSDVQSIYRQYTSAADLNIIDQNPGAIRNEVLPTGLTATNINNNNIARAFTSGFKGTLLTSFFQANITQLIDPNNGQLSLSITVAVDTKVDELHFYIFLIDKTELQSQCWIFVQTAVTKSTFGTQYTFFQPRYVNFDKNYISGLRSFSIRDNLQYNFTVNGLNFTTYSNSYYNDASHLNFWARQCPSPYTLFNQVDYLCYTACPDGTYLIVPDSLCLPCHYSCATCDSASNCITCPTNRIRSTSTGLCLCIDYYYQLNQVCIACHYSCKQCVYAGQYFNCISCDQAATHRTLITSNSTCSCDAGYQDIGTAICGDKCGDGIVNIDPCDDGNLNNNDGCSDTCQEQQYFDCSNDPTNTPDSFCYFVGDITIFLVRIQKDPLSNKATFYLNITPNVEIWVKLSKTNLFTNVSNYTFISVKPEGQLIAYTLAYGTDFQGQIITFGIKPSATGVLSGFQAKNVTFAAHADNGLLLNYYVNDDYLEGAQLGQAAYILGFIFTVLGIILCFDNWKQLGLELILSIQLCFMIFVVLANHDPYITKLMFVRNVMGWNRFIPIQIPPYHKVPVLEHMQYSIAFINNFNIMVIFPGIALLLYLSYRGTLYRHERKRIQGETSKQFEQTTTGKIFKHFKFQLFVYFMLFNMQQVLFSTVVQIQYVQNGAIFVYIVVCLIAIIICIAGLFIRPLSMQAYRKKLFHKSYGNRTFLIVLVSTLIMDLLILLSVVVNRNIFYAMFAFPLMLGIYLIARRPFKSIQNNIRLFIIQLCLIVAFGFHVAIINIPYLQSRTYPIVNLACMGMIFLVTFICWLIDIGKRIYRYNKQEYEKQSKQSQKEELSINQKVREAGFALVQGNLNGTKMPTTYQMGAMPKTTRKTSNLQPIRSPQQNSNLKKFGDQKLYSKSPRKTQKSPLPQSQFKTNQKLTKSNINNDTSIKQRQDTLQNINQSPSGRKRLNPYKQILDQTSQNRYK